MKISIVHKITAVILLMLFTITIQAQQDDVSNNTVVNSNTPTTISAYKSVQLKSGTRLVPSATGNIQVKIVQKPNQLYLDKDGDGFGILNTFYHATTHAAFKSSYVVGDCDDNNADIHPNTQWGLNPNGDGVTIQGNVITSCQSPGSNYIIVNGHEAKFNWTHTAAYDNYGKPIASSRTYFDDLGKANLSLSKDYTLNKIWATETAYDDFGRESKTSFPAFSPYNNFKKFGLVTTSPIVITELETVQGIVFPINYLNPQYYETFDNHVKYYSDANTEEPYQAIAEQAYTQINYDALNPGNVINVVGGNKIGGEWKTGYSFTVPAAQEMYYAFGRDYFKDHKESVNLSEFEKFYDSSKILPENTSIYYTQGLTSVRKKARIIYNQNSSYCSGDAPNEIYYPSGMATVEDGKIYKAKGTSGNVIIIEIVGDDNCNLLYPCGPCDSLILWSDGFNSIDELNAYYSKVAEYPIALSNYNNNNNYITGLKSHKQISIDPMGVETVSFSDSDGKALAVARSGGTTQYPVTSLIGEQGYVDIHIPVGCSGATFLGGASLYKVYNLKTGALLTETSNLQPGVYRVESKDKLGLFPYTFIDKTTGAIAPVSPSARGISYNVNYYDYSLNVYNKTGQLIKTVQPNGYEHNTVIKAQPAHMAPNATAFITTYKYNTLGQLIETTSPDEGTAKFAYRPDGQIRFSQNSLQVPNSKISYTEYDTYGRPVESGIIAQNNAWSWYVDLAKANGDLPNLPKSEQTFTIYDYPTNYTGSAPQPIESIGLSAEYKQENLSGNVVTSYNNESQSWYSYDIYGRLKWMAQLISGMGSKTIDYEYDGNGNVKKVIYQKNNASEMFVHRYTYDLVGKLLKAETSTNNSAFALQAEYKYYQDGKLKRVQLANGIQGTDYVYTLGGMLKSINHPSLLAANDPGKDSNDVFGITLDYYSGDYTRAGTNITTSTTTDNRYPDYYDGNIKATRWANRQLDVPTAGAPANAQAYMYQYNQNKWLKNATTATTNPTTQALTPTGKHTEGDLLYDANGNIKQLVRTDDAGSAQDIFLYKYASGKNQLSNVTDIQVTPYPVDMEGSYDYQYDAIGRLTQNVKENLFYTYNTQGLVTEVKKGTNSVVKFYYNERGHRTKKESYSPSTGALIRTEWYVLDASGNLMSTYAKPAAVTTITQGELPVYGASRLGIFYKDATNTNYQYQITDHLGNVRAVIKNTTGAPTLQSYADYYPFGEKLFSRNSSSNYRYAFQGQQLDNETGMEAFELRLWDGRIGRWLSPDPYGEFHSPYLGMGNNPISLIDPDGGKTTGSGTDPDPPIATEHLDEVTVIGTNKSSSIAKGYSFDHKTFQNSLFLASMPIGIAEDYLKTLTKDKFLIGTISDGHNTSFTSFDKTLSSSGIKNINVYDSKKIRITNNLRIVTPILGKIITGLDVASNTTQVYTGNIGFKRYVFRLSGTTLAWVASSELSAGASLIVGAAYMAGEAIYDDATQPGGYLYGVGKTIQNSFNFNSYDVYKGFGGR